jgi:hypothetical protein
MTDAKLTEFTHVKSGNVWEAYRSSYNATKMSQRSVENATSDLMKCPGVTVRLTRLRAEAVNRRPSARHGLSS